MVPLTVKFLKAQWRLFANAHPLAKGMISYAVLWPTSCMIQQTMQGKKLRDYDFLRALRFSLYGGLFVAPTLYGWVRLSTAMWPQTTLRIGIIKAITEQLAYGPFSCVSFFMGMSFLELKSFSEAVQEVKEKAWPTYKVGVCIWPIIQTVNFSMIPERNRLVFVSVCSLMWTTFLAYMEMKNMHEEELLEEKVDT